MGQGWMSRSAGVSRHRVWRPRVVFSIRHVVVVVVVAVMSETARSGVIHGIVGTVVVIVREDRGRTINVVVFAGEVRAGMADSRVGHRRRQRRTGGRSTGERPSLAEQTVFLFKSPREYLNSSHAISLSECGSRSSRTLFAQIW